jgi:uncharacterized protein
MSEIQYNPLRFPLFVTAKPMGAACNLRCDYCYFLEKKELHSSKKPLRMSDELLELFTEQYIQAQPSRNVQFTWHGGEPLLGGLDFYRKALHFQERFKRDYHIDNSLQTNGLLLDDDWCRFFRDHDFLIGLSLDGPEHCHDRFRKNQAGSGSFAQTMKGLELLQKHGVDFNILSVVNAWNVRFPLEVYDFFRSVGAQFIQFTPVVERKDLSNGRLQSGNELDGELTEESVPALAYGQFLNKIFDEWVRRDVGEIFVTNFDAVLAGHLGVAPGTCTYSETCGHAAALDVNGDLYACDHFFFPDYKRGNIREKTITEMMLSEAQTIFGNDKQIRLPQVCLECSFLRLCHGECPKNRFVHLPNEINPLNYLCPGLKELFRHTEKAMKFMAEEAINGRAPSNIVNQFGKSR